MIVLNSNVKFQSLKWIERLLNEVELVVCFASFALVIVFARKMIGKKNSFTS
jgi:hypothetical protein